MNDKIKYKKVGYFCEEMSARYEAIIQGQFKVRIWKCGYRRQWTFSFHTLYGFDLGEVNQELHAFYWGIATKKYVMDDVEDILGNSKWFDLISREAEKTSKQMKPYEKLY